MIWALALFGLVVLVLMAGYPVGFTLAGVSLLVAAVATAAESLIQPCCSRCRRECSAS